MQVGLALVDFGTDAVFVIAVLQTEISSCRDDMIAQALPIIVPAVFAFVFLLNGTVACWIFITELKNNLRVRLSLLYNDYYFPFLVPVPFFTRAIRFAHFLPLSAIMFGMPMSALFSEWAPLV